jgi:large repetitive protein
MKNLLLAILILFVSEQVLSQTITLGSLSSSNYCMGGSISVPFTSTGFSVGTPFTVTLRKGTTVINTANSTTSPINISIFYSQSYGYGTDYTVQVSSGAVSSLVSSNLTVGIITRSEIVDVNNNSLYFTSDQLCTGKTKVYYAKVSDNFGALVTSNVTYQWKKDGIDIPGATLSSLSVSVAGVYTFVATQSGCNVTAPNITLSFGTSGFNASTIYGDEVACTGTSKTIESSYYSNTATYQWQKDGVNISGATNRSYVATTSGVYKSTMTDGACIYNAGDRRITFGTGLLTFISVSNGDSTLCSTSSTSKTLFATYYSSVPTQYTYQWKKDGVNISGATGRDYTASQVGVYSVTYSQGSCASDSRGLSIVSSATAQKPVITSGSISSVCSGNINLNQNVNGVNTFIYGTWLKDGVAIPSYNNYQYTATTSGTYKLVNGYGTSCANESNAVAVSIGTTFTPQIYINSFYGNNNLCGTTDYKYISFDSRNLSGGTYTYQWIKNGVDIVGATTNELYVSPGNVNNVGTYTLRVTNGLCTVISNAIVITNNTPTTTISTSDNNISCLNKSVRLDLKGAVTFFNTPVTWQRNSVTIVGETSSFLYVTQGGSYTATYSQSGCAGTSTALTLNIVQPPIITVAPVTINNGQTATLSVAGCSGGTVTWYDAAVGGSLLHTGSSYTTPPLPASNTFYAYCVGISCPSVNRVAGVVNVTQLQTITLSNPSPTNICPGSSFSVGFTTTGTFNAGNTFQVQLSDLNGNFSFSPTVLATGNTSPITVNLDGNTPTSANYRIRVVATDPLTASSPSNFISINNTPTITSNGVVNCSVITLQTPNLSGRTYQWQKDGLDISGATSTSYSTFNAGIYTLVSTVGTCVKTSSPIQIYSYNSFPSVSLNGSSSTFCSGTSLVISANPNNPVSTYQWIKDGVDISGATSPTYTVTLAGAYSVRVTQGSCSPLTSSSTTLSTATGANSLDSFTSLLGGTDISPNYNVYSQPFNICSGSMILSSSQRSAGTTYQWQLDGVDILGQTSSTYTASQTGYYSVKVTQGTCTGASTPVALRIGSLTPPSLGADVSICTGATHNIINSINQGQPCCGTGLSYQWIKDGVDIPSAINQFSYTANAAGTYTLRVSQGACTSTSAPMRLVIGTAITSPIFFNNPVNDIACSGSTSQINFNNNLSNATYQWIKDGVDIPSATSTFYNTTQTGKYQVRVTQGTCTATSPEVQQIFGELGNPTISGSNRFCNPNSTTLSASPICSDYTYQWKRNGIAISGATLSSYTTNVPAVYTLDITKGTKTITTSSLSVYEDCSAASTSLVTPSVFSNTSDRVICINSGKQMIFTTNYSTTYPAVTYKWYKDGVLLAGQTSRFLFVTDAGNYQVQLVDGASQSTLSSNYTMYNSGNNIVISALNGNYGCTEVLLSSSIPNSTTKSSYAYQWKKDGVNIGTNQNFYSATASGNYSLDVTLGTCTISSLSTPVTIGNSTPTIVSSPSNNKLCDNGYVTLNTNLGNSFVHQWYKDNVLIPNINTRSYIALTAGSYSFTATQGACTYSSAAAVSVTTTSSLVPSIGYIGGFISSSNSSLTACSGSNTTLLVSPRTGIYQYQWKNAGSAIAGANTATYQPSTSGTYSADIATLGGCVVASPVFTLNLGTFPSIPLYSADIQGSNICNGSSVNLNVTPFNFDTYQWYKDDVLIPNATSTTYSANLAGNYNVRMTQGACTVGTGYIPVALSTTILAPRVSNVSTSNDISCNLISASLSTSSFKGGTYQWQRNGMNINGETNFSYSPTQNGTYLVIVNQGTCIGTSNSIEIQNGLSSTIYPNGPFGYICGDGASISTNFISSGTTYQWKKNGVNIGINSTSLTVNGLGTYTVTSTRSGCSVTSQPFVISTIAPMESTKTGVWNNSGVWTCLRIPNISDNVKVNFGHLVSLPNTSTYFIKSINNVGGVSFGTGSNLRIGF